VTVRRLKSYTAESGMVYQYYFVGKRAALADDPQSPATEFIFDVISGQQPNFAISIFLPEQSVKQWQQKHYRVLVETELYAGAKMMLFRAFDELESVIKQGRRLTVPPQELENLLEKLGLNV
jgi:hypothetical protein